MYNTATRKVEEFKPINANKVGMYVCGLTVYNDMHLGHARTYVSFDVIRRWLEYSGYEVTFVQNHTDIDDKIIQKANEEGILYGSVGIAEIVGALRGKDIQVNNEHVLLDGQIKEHGLFPVSIRLHQDIEVAELKVWVVPPAGDE